jgi:hypothetical protein
MYIMDLSIFGFKLNLEVLILIGIVYLILVVNTLTSCCNVSGITEGFAGGGLVAGTDNVVKDVAGQVAGGMNMFKNALR